MEAKQSSLLEEIEELKKDAPDMLKNMIESLLGEKYHYLEVIESLKKQITKLNADLANMTKSVQMLNSGTSSLNEILKIGQPSTSHRGLGYHYGASTSHKTVFVSPS